MKKATILMSSILMCFVCSCQNKKTSGQTIDEYVKKSNEYMLWGNGLSVGIKPVDNIKDTKTIFERAFKLMSYDEGRPKFEECRIVEEKYAVIHGSDYYLIRFIWKNKERILLINTNVDREGYWSVR